MRRNSSCLRVRYSCESGRIACVCLLRYSCGCGKIALIFGYAIGEDADENHVFACTLFVRMSTNNPSFVYVIRAVRPNVPCLRERYSCGCRRIALLIVYALRAHTDEKPMFTCTLFVRLRTNSHCLRVRYSCGCGRIACLCMYAIRADAYK